MVDIYKDAGSPTSSGRRYVSGHNLKGMKRTEEHRRKIGEALKIVWDTKRERHPIGSKNHDANGYVRVKVSPGSGAWSKEYSMVMEKHIGRPIKSGECVHHINGDRRDNRIENLYLCFSTSQHSRIDQSVKRLLKGLIAKGMIRFNKILGEYELVASR